jgi:hypothetical protein
VQHPPYGSATPGVPGLKGVPGQKKLKFFFLMTKNPILKYASNSKQYTAASVHVLTSLQFFICQLADDKSVLGGPAVIKNLYIPNFRLKFEYGTLPQAHE